MTDATTILNNIFKNVEEYTAIDLKVVEYVKRCESFPAVLHYTEELIEQKEKRQNSAMKIFADLKILSNITGIKYADKEKLPQILKRMIKILHLEEEFKHKMYLIEPINK